MGHPGIQMWTWTLCVFLSWMYVGQAVAGPQYMVAIPAVLEAGAITKFCASLLQINESLVMTVTLISNDKNRTILQLDSSEKLDSSENLHFCGHFEVPLVQNTEVEKLEVEVRGDRFYSKEVRKVMIKVYQPMTFIQTDKPFYLPGQTVHFRVVTLDTKLRPASQLYHIIEIVDANSNRIGQWLNKTSSGKILQLSHSLISEACEGTYKVVVEYDGNEIHQSFKVEKYVLPKFEVKINSPTEVSIVQERIKAEVCAKYTFGQPVPGNVTVHLCRPIRGYRDHDELAPHYKETKQTDKKGCATFIVEMSTFTFKNLDKNALKDNLDLKVTVEEEGTGISHSEAKIIDISYVAGKLSFIDTPKIYEQGSYVEGKVKAVYYNDTPTPDMPVYLFEGDKWQPRWLQNLTTDSNGEATFTFSTAKFQEDIHLHVNDNPTIEYRISSTVHYEPGDYTVSSAQTPSMDTKTVSSLEVKKKDKTLPCDREEDISIQYTIVKESQGTVDVMYLVLSRGAIVMGGVEHVEVQDTPVTEGKVSFKLKVSAEIAPDFQVVAYTVLPSETVIAHSAVFSTEKCFSHKVSVEFSTSSVTSGGQTELQVTAQPNSLCGVSAVDQSVLVKEPGKTLDADKIFDLLPVRMASYIPHEVQDLEGCLHVRPRRYILPYPGYNKEDDAYTVFKDVGLKMATNLVIRMPSCLEYKGKEYMQYIYGYGSNRYYSTPQVSTSAQSPSIIYSVRTFFPETWIWDLVEVGESGTKTVSFHVPDTITSWETEAFCLSPHGFGLAPRKQIKVFQPFFLELSLPYSIIRGELFELKATIFSYLKSCIMATVTAVPSSEYTLTPLLDSNYKFCLCGSDRKTVRWTMKPSVLGVINVSVIAEAIASEASCDNEIVIVPEAGRVDKVTRHLIVKAGGTEMTKTYNWLLCPKGETVTEEIDIQLPDDVIDGSARAALSVLGDILGRALKNVDGLLTKPYGCGEQNIALLAPNIYILQYLIDTNQLTPAIKEMAINFLTSGYQRQLNYKHPDGAYSTFGSGEGNTWLTAFVLRSFAKAQSFIYIDPTTITESKSWLEHKQREDGCFEQSGKLFNNRMKGGVSDNVTLTAYITAAFLEMNMSVHDVVVTNSLSCLRKSISNLNNTYATALLAYVFTLARDIETRAYLLKHLDTVAINQGGFLHWSQTATETSASLSVEISSYVLLAKISIPPTVEELGYANQIIRWLIRQQNPMGGFSSTQDTVVALQALALYSTLVFSPGGSTTVTALTPSGQLTFDVNKDNRLLYQEEMLKDVTGNFRLEVKGTACASMQISLYYNIPIPPDVTTLSVEVKPEANCTSKSQRPKLTLRLKSLYSGKESSTNMVILDIQILSGFVPDPESLKRLKHAVLVDQVEQKGDHVLVYIQELIKDIPINHSFELIQQHPVQNLKPAVVKIYDYYQPSDRAETEYTCPCARQSVEKK